MKKLAVVILNWNGCELMKRFLPSVLQYTPTEWAEVIVADNASMDGSVVFLKEQFPSVRIIVLDNNYGFAEGYNRAIEQVEAEYIVLLNSDIEVTQNWLEAPVSVLDTQPEVAAVQPKLLSERNRNYFEYAGAAGGFMDKYGYPFCRGRVFNVIEKDNGQYDTPVDILWATGACLIIRRSVYMDAGGLDARFFAHQEEIDLCWRLRSRGYRLQCIPQSVVYHVGGATLNVENPHKTFLNFRNNLLMLYKNLPEKELHRIFHYRFLFDYIAAFKFFISGHPANARAVYSARKAFFSMKKEYKAIRTENLQKTTITAIPEIYTKCLLVDFYLKGKKIFSDILKWE